MAKTYKLKLKLKSGLLTELQSDTIFGHFCWRLKESAGEDKLNQFLGEYKSGKPVFAISDGFLENAKGEIFFPKPYFSKNNVREKNGTKAEKIAAFLKNKEIKSRNFITLSQLNLFLSGKLEEYNKSFENQDVEIPKFEEDLRVSVEIDRHSFSAKEGRLFSYNPKYLMEEKKDKPVFISLFVKILDEDGFNKYDCKQALYNVFELGYGKKKSSGYGQFEVINALDEFNNFEEPENSNGFIVLGNYLPSESDKISNPFYSLNIKYGKLGEELSSSDNPFKKPIILMTAGSVFASDVKKDFYGRVTQEGEISAANKNVIQCGMPFTLNINANTGK